MNDGLVAQRYAKALYKFSLDKNLTQTVYEELAVVLEAFRKNPELNKVLSNPFVTDSDKKKLLLAAAGDKLENAYSGFVDLIIEKKRCDLAWEMALCYRTIYRKANNIASVKITTAAKMPEEEYAKLRKLVENSFKGMQLEFSYGVDPELIGGFTVKVNNVMMDSSLRNEIENLRLNLLSN